MSFYYKHKKVKNEKRNLGFDLKVSGSVSPFLFIIVVFIILVMNGVKIDPVMLDSFLKFLKGAVLYL